MRSLFEAHQGRLQIFTRGIGEMLMMVCSSCHLQGPFLDREEHRMECLGTVARENGLQAIWQCGECRSTKKQDIQVQMVQLEEVGSPGQEVDDTLKSDCAQEAQATEIATIVRSVKQRSRVLCHSIRNRRRHWYSVHS